MTSTANHRKIAAFCARLHLEQRAAKAATEIWRDRAGPDDDPEDYALLRIMLAEAWLEGYDAGRRNYGNH
ncbi:MAG TPA: hypothetical protein VK973_05870 [Arenicellales bacterium]|nr:hypothetical protein [Arenicellales bacterium]